MPIKSMCGWELPSCNRRIDRKVVEDKYAADGDFYFDKFAGIRQSNLFWQA